MRGAGRFGPGRYLAAVAVGAVAALPAVVLPAAPAHAAICVQPGEDVSAVPWPQRMLTPERVWPFTRGDGVTVAVLGTGVDGNQPQLRGHVLEGFDAVAGNGPANNDCLGVGTQIAGVIAAQPVQGIGLVGVAPGVRILPVRVIGDVSGSTPIFNPAALAKGIGWAMDHGADVLEVAVATTTDDPGVRDALARAISQGAVVVAAAGEIDPQNADVSVVSYPAAYPSVIGVGALDAAGNRAGSSPPGPMIDLVAPGAGVGATQAGHGLVEAGGTGVASGFVAGTAALVRARFGKSATGPEVERRLNATASPVGDSVGPAFGHGAVNPYAAVTGQVSKASPAALPALDARPGTPDDDLAARRQRAMIGAGAGILASLTVLALAVALPRARRRRWRSAVAPEPPQRPDAEPGPPVQLFEDPASS